VKETPIFPAERYPEVLLPAQAAAEEGVAAAVEVAAVAEEVAAAQPEAAESYRP
jgi:hypothetical protein